MNGNTFINNQYVEWHHSMQNLSQLKLITIWTHKIKSQWKQQYWRTKKGPRSISFRGPNANVVKLWQKQLILRQAVILSSLEREFFFFSKYIDIIFSRIHLLWTCNECQRRDYVVHRKYLIISIFSCGEQFQNHKISNMAWIK